MKNPKAKLQKKSFFLKKGGKVTYAFGRMCMESPKN